MTKITWLGHGSWQIETPEYIILLDPFLSGNPAATADPATIAADFILVSHGHSDHVGDTIAIARRTGATVAANFEICQWLAKHGVKRIEPMNLGGSIRLPFGRVKMTLALHSSALPDGTYGGNPGGFVIWNDEACFYLARNTALTMDMKLLPLTCPKLDFAILPIGDNFTMGYEDAVIASGYIECDKIIGCHYDTFGYIKIDHDAAKKAFADSGKELILLPVGGSLDF